MATAATIATGLPSILLILALAFTTVLANRPPSDEAIVMKKCTEALGPRASNFVTFCARNLLGHRAALLATCDARKTVALVIKEVHNKAKAVEALETKITSSDDYKSSSTKDARDLKSCWGVTNKVVSSIANVFDDSLVMKGLSNESITMLKGIHGDVATIRQRCDSSVPGRQNGLWLELRLKALESLTADMVAWAFVDHLYSTAH